MQSYMFNPHNGSLFFICWIRNKDKPPLWVRNLIWRRSFKPSTKATWLHICITFISLLKRTEHKHKGHSVQWKDSFVSVKGVKTERGIASPTAGLQSHSVSLSGDDIRPVDWAHHSGASVHHLTHLITRFLSTGDYSPQLLTIRSPASVFRVGATLWHLAVHTRGCFAGWQEKQRGFKKQNVVALETTETRSAVSVTHSFSAGRRPV